MNMCEELSALPMPASHPCILLPVKLHLEVGVSTRTRVWVKWSGRGQMWLLRYSGDLGLP